MMRQEHAQQLCQIVRFLNIDIEFFEQCLQILLRGLLAMKANKVMKRLVACGRSSAACRSSSAFSIHSHVALFIKERSAGHDMGMEQIAIFQSPLDILRSSYDQVHRKGSFNSHANLKRLIRRIPTRHDHQNVHIAIGVRLAIGVGAEQDDLFGSEPLGHLVGKLPDDAQGNVCTTKPAVVPLGRVDCSSFRACLDHHCILQRFSTEMRIE